MNSKHVLGIAWLLAASLAPAVVIAQDRDKEKDDGRKKEEGDKDDRGRKKDDRDDEGDEDFKRRIERQLLSSDRATRQKAAAEVLRRDRPLDEDFWFKLLDTTFPTDDEQEEAKAWAAQALWRVGTSRSLPRLDAMCAETPKVVNPAEKPGALPVAKNGYQYWAVVARSSIRIDAAEEKLLASLASLDVQTRADKLALYWLDRGDAWKTFRPEGAEETAPPFWDFHLEKQIVALGSAGAWGLVHAVSKQEDPLRRGRLSELLYKDFIEKPRQAKPPAPIEKSLREAFIALALDELRYLGRTNSVSVYQIHVWALRPAADLKLVEVEPELIAFATRGTKGLSEAIAEKDRDLVIRGAAGVLAVIGTETGLDVAATFVVDSLLNPKGLVPRYTTMLEHESAATMRFHHIIGDLWNNLKYTEPYLDLSRFEAIRVRVEGDLKKASDADRFNIQQNLFHLIGFMNDIKAARAGKDDERKKKEKEEKHEDKEGAEKKGGGR